MNKKELRKEILTRRDALSQEDRCEKNKRIVRKVIGLKEFQNSNKVLLYSPIRSEVEVEEIYLESRRLGKDVYYPKVQGREMDFFLVNEKTEFETGKFDICEPKPESTEKYLLCEEDMVLAVIPGTVFDMEGNRIGYGGGYYDKYLHKMSKNICKVAVAYQCQLVDIGEIEKESHDVQMDYVITEET